MAGGYPELVAPIVPDAQRNRAPDILLEGWRTGLAAAVQLSNQKRESELDMLRMAQQERLTRDQHAIEREKINKDTQYQDQMLQSHANYYDAMGRAATVRADAYARGVTGMADQGEQKAEFYKGFQDRVNELRLTDPKLETDDPAQFYLNTRELTKNYGTSTIPEIRKALSAFKVQAEQHKLMLPKVTYDTDGNPVKAGNVDPHVVVGEIVERLHDPATRKEYMDRLKAGGYIKPGETKKVKKGSWWQRKWTETTQEPDVVTPPAEDLLNKSETADFGSGAVIQQPDFSKKARDFRAVPSPDEPTPTPDPNASVAPASSATPETDQWLQNALKAIKMGAEPKAVAQRLTENGIDPSLLWA